MGSKNLGALLSYSFVQELTGLWGDEGLAHVSALGLVKQRVLYNASPAQRGMKYAERSCLCPPGPWEMQSGGEERK